MNGPPGGSSDLNRLLMDRARAHAERDRARAPRRVIPMILGGLAAVGIVLVFLFGFDAFLTSMQKFLEVEVTDPAPEVTAPMPAFVVTGDAEESAAGDEAPPRSVRDE